MLIQGIPPDWLLAPALAVLEDLQGAQSIRGLRIVATVMDSDLNGLFLAVAEPSRVNADLQPLPDDLDPDRPTEYGGGNWVPRSMDGSELLVRVAELLQEDLAETAVAWGQARPPCLYHPHPARPSIRDQEAWWRCELDDKPLYRIGKGEVPARLSTPPSWHPQKSRRAHKRRHR